MPIRRKLDDASVFQPEEVELLISVFVATSYDGENEVEKENRASRIIANYQLGITDKAELIELSRRPLAR